jgi:hypothetical protein
MFTVSRGPVKGRKVRGIELDLLPAVVGQHANDTGEAPVDLV